MELTASETVRIQETLKLIPLDIVSILDVGCGDGRITNSILPNHKIIGIDINAERIRIFQGLKIIGDASRMPFKDSEFDLVLAAEILEHIPERIFTQAVNEIFRVARKFILITVPFKEVLPSQWLKCSKCGHIFHAWGHLRKFHFHMLNNLFPKVRLVERKLFGPEETVMPSLLYIVAKKTGKAWQYNGTISVVCPKCGSPPLKNEGNIFGWILIRVIRQFEKIIHFQKRPWIGCLYRKI